MPLSAKVANPDMANHPNRSRPQGPFSTLDGQSETLKALRADATLTQPAMAALCRAGLQTWRQWERGERPIPWAAMELLCLALIVGTVADGPHVAPGNWLLPWVRPEFALWFQKTA